MLQVAPHTAVQGEPLTLTTPEVYDLDGMTWRVEFYRDANANGTLEVGTDDLLGTDSSFGGSWSRTGIVTWAPGTHTYFARAQDGDGAWSAVVYAAGQVANSVPAVDGLMGSPDPVTLGNELTLTAVGVGDQDGTVALVQFYGDGNANGVLDLAVDIFLASDADGADGWSWTGIVTWKAGMHTYFVRARDNDGAWSNVASVEGTVAGDNAVVESHVYGDGVTVTVYDADATNGISTPDVAWSVAEFEPGVTDVLVDAGAPGDGAVDSITLLGDGTDTEELGFVIEGGLGLGTFSDERSGTPPVAFLACEGDVGEVYVRAGAAGGKLNGFATSAGWTLPADLDGDGVTDDLTAVYASGSIGMLVAWQDLNGDVVCNQRLSTMRVVGGSVRGALHAGGHLSALVVRGADGVVGAVVADEGVRREEVAVSLAGSAAASGDPHLLHAPGIPEATGLRAGAVDEVFVTGQIGGEDTGGGWIVPRAVSGGFWRAGGFASGWITRAERVYFGDVWTWDILLRESFVPQ